MRLASHHALRLVLLFVAACSTAERPGPGDTGVAPEVEGDLTLALASDTLVPVVVTDTVPGDSDDPAIWVNAEDPARSLVLGTDKGDTTGGVYAFTLDGRIDRARSVTPLQRMNNVDVQMGAALGPGLEDIAVATERRRMALRVFSLPSMQLVDGGGIPVFGGDTARAPMGIALYKRPRDGAVFAIVGGKGGPTNGTYLAQYRLQATGGRVSASLVRMFGAYSGRKEIEAIAMDDALGYVYYSDEGVGVRKYHADPDSGAAELALFATTGVVEDHEGIAIYPRPDGTGYLLLSDQQGRRLHVFPREGSAGNPHRHPLLAVVPVRALETDGIEISADPLGPAFPRGLLVTMSDGGVFHFYRWDDVARAIDAVRQRAR